VSNEGIRKSREAPSPFLDESVVRRKVTTIDWETLAWYTYQEGQFC
jgi:hypothetical protein